VRTDRRRQLEAFLVAVGAGFDADVAQRVQGASHAVEDNE
jgi:hypothetical protein